MAQNLFSISTNIVLIEQKQIVFGTINVEAGKIKHIQVLENQPKQGFPFAIPGFVDSHVHIESSMLVPSEFARLAVLHGTVATVSDPHEIANVCGVQGVQYMINNGKQVPFKFYFGAPSCVPATSFETAGATVSVAEVDELLASNDIYYLSEMMNFPGVIFNDEEVHAKLAAAKKHNKPIDGHAPALRGEQAQKYFSYGITTDHECFTLEEAQEKLGLGVKILIREGSAAKNFEALQPLIDKHYENMMFCSDDKHPDELLLGHINQLCARAVALGDDVFKVLQMACINPVKHYALKNGLLRQGDDADFVLLKDLVAFDVLQTFMNGELLAKEAVSFIESKAINVINNFNCKPKQPNDFIVAYKGEETIPVIEAIEGQLITKRLMLKPNAVGGEIETDIANDVLKLVVVNRYNEAKPAVSFIKNFGFKSGAIASTVAHDSHNIIAVGVTNAEICEAINAVIKAQGGISAYANNQTKVLPLPVAGLMATSKAEDVAAAYTEINNFVATAMGGSMQAPYMTLSFMALLVIPHLKLSDKGLFDGDKFEFVQ
jgi:adenine deaminase